jgi:lactoylglutathione lyase
MVFRWTRSYLLPLLAVTSINTARAFRPSHNRNLRTFATTATTTSTFLRNTLLVHHNYNNQRISTNINSMSMSASTASTADQDVTAIPGRPTWQQTQLRIKDPVKSVKFYTEQLGFTLIDTFDFPQYKFSLYFVTTLPAGTKYDLTPGTQAAHDYLWSMDGTAIELTHNHGTENDESFAGYHAGNQDKDGFGHVAVK